MQKVHTKLNILFRQNTENTKYYILFNVNRYKNLSDLSNVTDVIITYIVLRQICFSLD